MDSKFLVFDINKRVQNVLSFAELVDSYPNANLSILKEESILIVSIYEKGKKVAIINRIKDGD